MAIIFDLDQTLIDSSLAEPYRKYPHWQTAYSHIPDFIFYDGLSSVFEYISEKKIKTCIVTSSTSDYCRRVVQHWGIKTDFHICYHDTTRRKPHPDPFNKAIERFACKPDIVLSVGDRDVDIKASHAAGIKSVACLWGASDRESLLNAKPTYVAETPADLLRIIQEIYP